MRRRWNLIFLIWCVLALGLQGLSCGSGTTEVEIALCEGDFDCPEGEFCSTMGVCEVE